MSRAISTATTSSASSPGQCRIGHVRYSTTGETALRNVQPLFAELANGGFAVAHNGNLSNAMALRTALIRRGSIFQSTSDTEVIIHLVATSTYSTPLDRLTDALGQVEGAYSLLVLTPDGLVACRDPLGIRPLVMGKLGDAVIFASESVALDVIGATYVRDIEPGELVIVNDSGVRSVRPFAPASPRPCIFEHVYFSRPDSVVDGRSVYESRKQIGAELSREAPVVADYVVPVPDSRRSRGDRLQPGIGHPVRARHHPLALCRADLHPAQRRHPPPRREAEAQRQFGADQGQAHRPDRRFDRPRHDQREDRPDDARCRRRRSPYADRLAADAAQLLLRRRHARALEAARRATWMSRRCAHYINADSLAFITIDGLYRALGDQRDGAPAAALRRLLHRRLSDHADRLRPGAASAGRSALVASR